MTIGTSSSATILQGNGATAVWTYNFVLDDPADLNVIYTDATGAQTVINPINYILFRNPVQVGQLHSVGGTVTFPVNGSPIANGTSLTLIRIVPLTQTTQISNQGDFYPTVTERALDELCLEVQQVSARTGQLRGTWVTGVNYNFGDIVQDGANGNDTQNYYTCIISNLSGTWSTDLAAGDWALGINIQQTSQYAIDAAASAAAAAVSATDAATSASASANSANASGLSAAAASASATNAATSATTASTQASNASTSASAASTSAGLAATSAADASNSASAASSSANAASASATGAANSAAAAATSATNAASSATAAAASATQAAGSLLGTSTSSNSVGLGAKTFTTQSGLSLGVGGFITIADTGTPANYMHGQVTSYSGTTLIANVLDIGGTGTHASWSITTSSPQGPTGSGSGTVNAGTAFQLAYYAGTGTAVSGNANMTIATAALTLGQAGSAQGSLLLAGSTSGTTTLAAPVAGTGTMTLQAGTDTLTGRATTDTLTNKTLSASSNVLGGVTMTLGSDGTGDIYYRSAGGVLTRLANGGVNKVLHGSSTVPSYSAVVEGDLGLTDITTANVTSTAHGFTPKSPGSATQFLNGAATPVFAAVKDSDLSVSDITTNNVTSTLHGFAPKSPADATKFLNGGSTPAYAAVKDSDLSLSDITTNNVSTSNHGFAPKLPNNALVFLDGTGNYSAPVATSSYTFLGSLTASVSATLDFTSLITSTYNEYVFELEDIRSSAGGADIYMRTSADNSTYATSGYTGAGSVNSITPTITAKASALVGMTLAYNVGAPASASVCGTVKFYNPLGTTNAKRIVSQTVYQDNSGTDSSCFMGCQKTATAAILAVRFLFSTGSITSGTIRMYGIKKS